MTRCSDRGGGIQVLGDSNHACSHPRILTCTRSNSRSPSAGQPLRSHGFGMSEHTCTPVSLPVTVKVLRMNATGRGGFLSPGLQSVLSGPRIAKLWVWILQPHQARTVYGLTHRGTHVQNGAHQWPWRTGHVTGRARGQGTRSRCLRICSHGMAKPAVFSKNHQALYLRKPPQPLSSPYSCHQDPKQPLSTLLKATGGCRSPRKPP